MDGDPLSYLMYLMFFRGNKVIIKHKVMTITFQNIKFTVTTCEPNINWSALGINTNDVTVTIPEPALPNEAHAVRKTHIFALIYVILHGSLIFTTLFSLCK